MAASDTMKIDLHHPDAGMTVIITINIDRLKRQKQWTIEMPPRFLRWLSGWRPASGGCGTAIERLDRF
jgi:hypothetical protein